MLSQVTENKLYYLNKLTDSAKESFYMTILLIEISKIKIQSGYNVYVLFILH